MIERAACTRKVERGIEYLSIEASDAELTGFPVSLSVDGLAVYRVDIERDVEDEAVLARYESKDGLVELTVFND